MARKWLEGAAGLRQETLTQPFTKRTDKRADELISASLSKKQKKIAAPFLPVDAATGREGVFYFPKNFLLKAAC